jgi:uncharacterized coiled-coil protein SlyX
VQSPLAEIEAALAEIESALAEIESALAEVESALAEIEAALAEVEAALAEVEACGLALGTTQVICPWGYLGRGEPMLKKTLLLTALSLTGCAAPPVDALQASTGCDALYESCCAICRATPPPVPAACWAGCMTLYAACLAEEG